MSKFKAGDFIIEKESYSIGIVQFKGQVISVNKYRKSYLVKFIIPNSGKDIIEQSFDVIDIGYILDLSQQYKFDLEKELK